MCFVFLSCSEKKARQQEVIHKENYADPLIKLNKKLIEKESRDIDNWLKRHNIDASNTGTGLRFFILKKGNGNPAKIGQFATINYKLSLLDGTLCYDSNKSGPVTFLIGQDHVESGLHEAMLLLRKGDRAKFVLPSYRAFGLTGEGKIPMNAAVVYDIYLVEIQ